VVRGRPGVLRLALLAGGAGAALAAALVSPGRAAAAAGQAWPPFVLVAGLLVIGALAARDGLFEAAGAAAARLPGEGRRLLVTLLLLDALVTAVLNLDTAVVFLTPVLLHAARRRDLDERPFLYGSVFMANAASLLLPGSNLTNLLVLAREHTAGGVFAVRMLPAWVASIAVVVVVLGVVYRTELRGGRADDAPPPQARLRAGAVGVVGAAILVLALTEPALPVVVLAVVLAAWTRMRPRAAVVAASPSLLIGVFGVAVALGAVARGIARLGDLVTTTGAWATAGLGAGAALLVNNLPAAVMLSAHAPAHPRALLVGLDLGPNLAVTGSLSAVLWLQVARSVGARPSVATYSRLGLLVAPLGIAAALAALSLFAPPGF
jgi:arsenical pump membrane protein